MLIKNAILEKIVAGEISILFRRWKRQSVKPDGTQMTQMGILAIDAVEKLTEDQITENDAASAGFASRNDLIASLPRSSDPIYRISVRFIGEDPRIALRQSDDLSDTELNTIIEKLNKMDSRTSAGIWTQKYLEMIRDRPNTGAAILAAAVGLETAKFKPQVRKLKALGLTESLDIGYRLSPRGKKVLEKIRS